MSWFTFLLTPLSVVVTASGTIFWGCWRSYIFDNQNPSGLLEAGAQTQDLPLAAALAIPVVASLSLVLIFLFYEIAYQVLITIMCFVGTFALAFALKPYICALIAALVSPSAASSVIRLCSLGYCNSVEVGLIMLSVTTTMFWLFTGHWMLNNVVGIAYCIIPLVFLRLRSLKISVALLAGLFLYDIFWVFFSKPVTGVNVMVDVATRPPPPEPTLFGFIRIAKGLQLPVKLLFPQWTTTENNESDFSILGLGDIVLPGLLVGYALRFDCWLQSTKDTPTPSVSPTSIALPQNTPHFKTAMVGYTAGLIITIIMVAIFKVGQPALLYLVPCTVFPLFVCGWKHGCLKELWEGPPPIEQPPPKDECV